MVSWCYNDLLSIGKLIIQRAAKIMVGGFIAYGSTHIDPPFAVSSVTQVWLPFVTKRKILASFFVMG
jgi:hypothetical protein